MNYLIIEGYQSAASKFAQEANISSSVALDSIEDRIRIRAAIHAGHIPEAVERINDLNPEVCILSILCYVVFRAIWDVVGGRYD